MFMKKMLANDWKVDTNNLKYSFSDDDIAKKYKNLLFK